ncbi:DNA topoisomerase-1 [Paraburkholderia caballeronis]|nr:DNA topoisomerase-1 [Paraburkholderia caballeronis]
MRIDTSPPPGPSAPADDADARAKRTVRVGRQKKPAATERSNGSARRKPERGAASAGVEPRARHAKLAATRSAVPPPFLAEKAAPRARALRRSSDLTPGYTRRLQGDRFAYFDTDGRRIRDAETIARIDSLAIPPAYTDVWICADELGHLQATGRDARGRKQYRYHPRWRDARDRDKFAKLAGFARALPRIRARVAADLRQRGLPSDKVAAAIVRLLDSTLVRIGNEEYVRENASYGLTTLCKRHLRTDGQRLTLCFNGKHGISHEVPVDDPDVVRVIRDCAEHRGRALFRYVDANGVHKISAADVNAYLHAAGGDAFTAKDYRTWAASAIALERLRAAEPPRSARAARSAVVQVAREVAALLRNTPAVCRASYIHPAVIEAFAAGELPALRCRVRSAGLSIAERRLATLLSACTPDR